MWVWKSNDGILFKKIIYVEVRVMREIDAIIKASDNEFVAELDLEKCKIIYTKDFYIALYKKLELGLNPVEAYESLGFNAKELGTNRAYNAARHAKERVSKTGYTVDPANYDGSVPRELMGDLTPAEEVAYLRARNIYLESIIEAQKKMPELLQESLMFLKKK